MSRIYILVLIWVIGFQAVLAQFASPQTLAPADAWEVVVNLPKAQRIYLIGEVKDKTGKTLLISRSEQYNANGGHSILSKQFIRTANLDYKDSDAQKSVNQTGNFPKGSYTICTKIMDVQSQSQIDEICREVEVGDPILMNGNKKPLGMLDFYGSANIETNYMNPNSYFTQYPTAFVRADAQQGIQLYGIPISVQGRYTTEKGTLNQDVNMFRINFDRNRFDAKAKEIILRKLAETQLQKVAKYASDLQTLTEIENAEGLVKQEAKGILDEKIKRTEAELREYASDNSEGARKKYDETRKIYDKLLKEKKKLDQVKQKYDELMSVKKQWIDSGKWQQLQDLAYNPPDLSDPKIILSELKKYGLFNGANKYLYSIQELSIGSAFPVFSPLTLNGIQVNGGSIAYNPGVVRLAAAGGQVQSYSPTNEFLPQGRFKQNLMAARVGLGQEYGSSINFSAVRFQDIKSVSEGVTALPQNAWVGGTDFKLSIGKNRIIEWTGEVAGLALNQNTRDTLKNTFAISDRLKSINTNLSTSFDFAATSGIALNLFEGNTTLSANGQFVGPGFNHPGSFGLRNDVLRKDFKLSQQIANRKMDLALQYITEEDNFSQSKGYNTDMRQIGVQLGFNLPKFANMRIQLTNILLNSIFYTYDSRVGNITLLRNWKSSGPISGNTMINVALYQTKTDSVSQDIQSGFFNLNQTINFNSFFVSLSGQYSHNATSIFTRTQSGVNANVGMQLKKVARIQIGTMYNQVTKDDYRLGFTADVQAQVIKNLTFSTRAFYNDYSQYPQQLTGRQEQIIQSSLRYPW